MAGFDPPGDKRHADLAEALGIPSFAVGAGFELISSGEIPEDLDEEALVWTKDLAPAEPGSATASQSKIQPVPGFYKLSFRARPGLARSIPIGWFPGTWAELECLESELPEGFRQATAGHREILRNLGFSEQGFKQPKPGQVLNPCFRAMGGINYLDGSRCHFAQLLYNRHYAESLDAEREKVTISFTAVFPQENLSYTNNPQALPGTPRHQKVCRVRSDDVALIYRQFVDELNRREDRPRHFSDLNSLRSWYDSNAVQVFQHNVRQGLWIRMSDYEVAGARSKLAPQPRPT